MVFLIATSLQAQTHTSTTSKSTSSISIHSDSDDNNTSYSYSNSSKQDRNVSVSISNSDDSYTMRAQYPTNKYQEIKDVLVKEMNSKNHTTSNGKDLWNSTSNGDEVYEIVLKEDKLTIDLDKEIASSSLAEKFKTLGLTIRTIIVGKANESRREAERLQRDADRLRRDAERMQREAERMQREAEKQSQSISKNYRRDAKKIADEARKLASQALELNTTASHKGGISGDIRMLLGDSKTAYNANTKSSFNWTWPDAQRDIIDALKRENLIYTENDISFTYDESGMYANGIKLNTSQINTFNTIFYKHNMFKKYGFSFYASYNHIVLIDDGVALKDCIEALVSEAFISSKNEKVTFQINGHTAYKNGVQLSSTQLQKLNTLLLKNNIIPAPGKVIEIVKPDNFKLGYSIGKRKHLGTYYLKH